MRTLAWALLGLAVGGLLLAGCGAPAPSESAAALAPSAGTITAEPTATPEPAMTLGPAAAAPLTETEAPLAAAVTPTPTPPSATPNPSLILTFTPTEPPTPDPEQGVQTVIYADDFRGDSGWAWPFAEDDVAAFSLGGGRLNAVMKVGNVGGPRLVSGQPTLQIGDQQLQVTALTNLCYAKDEYGVLLRANTTATDGYLFKLNCEGKARVEALHNLKPTVLVDWTASPAIVANAPAENTLLVWAGRDLLHFFVNRKYLFSVTDKTFARGTYGFYIYDHTTGGVSVSFDQLVVKAVSLP